MAENKYGKYIKKNPVGKSIFEQVAAPQLQINGKKDCEGAGISMNWSYITKPFVVSDEAHTNDYDRMLCFIGEDPSNVTAFDAEIELSLGEEKEKNTIDTTSFVYIPKGLVHFPLEIKRVGRPFLFIDMELAGQPAD